MFRLLMPLCPSAAIVAAVIVLIQATILHANDAVFEKLVLSTVLIWFATLLISHFD